MVAVGRRPAQTLLDMSRGIGSNALGLWIFESEALLGGALMAAGLPGVGSEMRCLYGMEEAASA